MVTTTGVGEPSGRPSAGTTARTPSAEASTDVAGSPPISTVTCCPAKPSPRISTVWPGIATSGSMAVAFAVAATVNITGAERPPFVSTTTGTCASTPPGTTAWISVLLADVTVPRRAPKSTVFPAASPAKPVPVSVTGWPASACSGAIERSCGAAARKRKSHASPPMTARPSTPPRRGSGTEGRAVARRRRPPGRPLPAALREGRSDGNACSAGSPRSASCRSDRSAAAIGIDGSSVSYCGSRAGRGGGGGGASGGGGAVSRSARGGAGGGGGAGGTGAASALARGGGGGGAA